MIHLETIKDLNEMMITHMARERLLGTRHSPESDMINALHAVLAQRTTLNRHISYRTSDKDGTVTAAHMEFRILVPLSELQ